MTKEDKKTRTVFPRSAVLHLDGWGGRTQQHCIVIAETPKRYRVRAINGGELRVPTRGQGLLLIHWPGTYLVPKRAITFPEKSDV